MNKKIESYKEKLNGNNNQIKSCTRQLQFPNYWARCSILVYKPMSISKLSNSGRWFSDVDSKIEVTGKASNYRV
jgi:hypothetical protein